MNEQQKIMAGGVLGVALIAALIYYFFYKGKGATGVQLGSGQKKPSGTTQVGGGTSVGSAPNVVYVTPQVGTPDANIVARFWQYSDTMRRIQQNMNDTCFRTTQKVTVDGKLGNETLNAIKSWASNIGSQYGQQIAREIEATQYVTKAQADWLLKPCGTASTVGATPSGTSSGAVTLSNYRTASLADRNALTNRVLGVGTAGSWTESQMYEWLYAYLKGAEFFNCTKCLWGYGGYYSTRDLTRFGSLANLPAGAKYIESEGGSLKTK